MLDSSLPIQDFRGIKVSRFQAEAQYGRIVYSDEQVVIRRRYDHDTGDLEVRVHRIIAGYEQYPPGYVRGHNFLVYINKF
jgi:hypothetical protein